MKRAVMVLFLFTLAGCSTPAGRGPRWLPWNWASPDHATQLEAAQGRTHEAEARQVKVAQQHVRATAQALATEPEPSRSVEVARDLNARADAALAQAVGPLSAEEDRTLARMVAQLTSENAALRAEGAAALAARDRHEAALSREIEILRAREAEVTSRLIESDRRYQAQAEKHRRLWFWIWLILGGWIVLQILAGIARFYPALAPVSRLAGMVTAPALQASYDRFSTAVGRTLADAQRASDDVAERLRDLLDRNTDAPEQQAIRHNYEIATRP